jgi:UDP-GlcNAc:undecaprenyl-phosphate GlcNAc-1-phosphate transferase
MGKERKNAAMMLPWTRILFLAGAGLLCFGVTRTLIKETIRLFKDAGLVRENYRGRQVVTGTGMALVLGMIGAGACVTVFGPSIGAWAETSGLAELCLLGGGMGLIGFLDDVAGNRCYGGFRGHFQFLWKKGEMTTGTIKALTGLALALLVTLHWERGMPVQLFGGLAIALGANAFNLLDVRPGRALKAAMLSLLALAAGASTDWTAWTLLLAVVFAFVPFDLGEKAMLGDTGANFLGAVLTDLALRDMPLAGVLAVCACIAGIHVYTEWHSLNDVIENNRLLRWVDGIGRH